jgi:hypothetical protein
VCRYFCSNLNCIPLGIYLGVVWLDHMADLFLVFLRSLHTVFHSGVLVYIPTSSVWGFTFPASSPTVMKTSGTEERAWIWIYAATPNFWQRWQNHTMEKRQPLPKMFQGKVVICCRKLKLDSSLSFCTRINSKWIKNTNIRSKTLKSVQERSGNTLEV